MNYVGIIFLACAVILLWILSLTLPVPVKESFSSGFTLKYQSMTTQTDPEPEVVPPMPQMAFENTEVQCDHGVCSTEESSREEDIVPFVETHVPEKTTSTHMEVEPTYERTRDMVPPRKDGMLESDWFQLYPREGVKILNSNPFRV